MVVAGVSAAAQPAAGVAGDGPLLEVLVDDLNASDLASREAAQALISTLGPEVLPELERLLTAGELDAEQSIRLAEAAVDVFARSPRAAMGIRFGGLIEGGVLIQSTVADAGFDAETKLAANDVIVEAGGRPMLEQNDLRIAILSRNPGETLPVRVRRNGNIIELDIVLGDLRDLAVPALDDTTARLAWEARMTRRGIDASWGGPIMRLTEGGSTDLRVTRTPEGLEPGGELRRDSFRGGAPRQLSARDRVRMLRPPDAGGEPMQRARLMQQLALLRLEQQNFARRIASNERVIRDPSLSPERRAALVADIERFRTRMDDLDAEMRELRRSLLGE